MIGRGVAVARGELGSRHGVGADMAWQALQSEPCSEGFGADPLRAALEWWVREAGRHTGSKAAHPTGRRTNAGNHCCQPGAPVGRPPLAVPKKQPSSRGGGDATPRRAGRPKNIADPWLCASRLLVTHQT